MRSNGFSQLALARLVANHFTINPNAQDRALVFFVLDDPRDAQPPPFHLRPASLGLYLARVAVAAKTAVFLRHEQPRLRAFPIDAARDQRAQRRLGVRRRRHPEAAPDGVFAAYYAEATPETVFFDTNRGWTTKLPALVELFSDAKVICSVHNPAWILDSVESLIRRSAFELSGIFSYESGGTVYSRIEGLASPAGMFGFAYNALREAVYGSRTACSSCVTKAWSPIRSARSPPSMASLARTCTRMIRATSSPATT
jgi:hypothetical protein